MFVRRRFCSFGGSAAPGAVSELRVGAAGAGALPAAILEGAFPPRWCFLQSFGGGCSRCCLSPSLSLPSGFFFLLLLYFGRRVGKKEKKKKKTSSFVGCRKASWDSWPARAGKRESGRGETNLCPACLARGLRAPNGHLRAPALQTPFPIGGVGIGKEAAAACRALRCEHLPVLSDPLGSASALLPGGEEPDGGRTTSSCQWPSGSSLLPKCAERSGSKRTAPGGQALSQVDCFGAWLVLHSIFGAGLESLGTSFFFFFLLFLVNISALMTL